MAGSPFKGQGGTATAAPAKKAAPAAAAKAAPKGKQAEPDDLPDATDVGGDTPISNDPYSADPADPSGVAGYKPGHFMDQLVLLHFTEVGRMKTVNSGNEEDGKSPFVRLDLIPLTLPDEFGFTNKYDEYEPCEPFEVGERLEELLFFNKPLVREGKRALDKGISWVLGRITKGTRKEGQDAPVILVAASDEDKQLYADWRQSVAKG